MKNRMKWILVGLGFTFGLQVLLSLVFTGVAISAASSPTGIQQGTPTLLAFGFTLGAFLIGGFVIGWMSEEIRVTDALIVAAVTLVLSALVYTILAEGNRGMFVTGGWLSEPSTRIAADGTTRMSSQIAFGGRSMLFVSLALIASAIGSYWGWHVKVPQERMLDRVALLLGLIGAVVGPFVLLAVGGKEPGNQNVTNLPWYFLVIVLVLVLAIVAAGFVMFTRESHYEEEISISPDTRRE